MATETCLPMLLLWPFKWFPACTIHCAYLLSPISLQRCKKVKEMEKQVTKAKSKEKRRRVNPVGLRGDFDLFYWRQKERPWDRHTSTRITFYYLSWDLPYFILLLLLLSKLQVVIKNQREIKYCTEYNSFSCISQYNFNWFCSLFK